MRKERVEYDSPVDALVAITKRLSFYEGRYLTTSEEFFDKFNSAQIAKVSQKFLRNVLLWINRRKYLKKFGLWFIVKCGMYYPLMIIAKKRVKGEE